VTALLLSAVGSTGRETGLWKLVLGKNGVCRYAYVALSADHLVAVELGSKGLERWLNDTTTETENKVKSGLLLKHSCQLSFEHIANLFCCPAFLCLFILVSMPLQALYAYLLDVVIGESSSVLELLSGENQSLLVGWNAFLVLDLALDIVDRVG